MPKTLRARFAPVERFRKLDGRVQFRHGDLAFLAEELGKTSGHIARVISGERPGDELRQQIERLVGVPCDHIDLAGKRRTTAA